MKKCKCEEWDEYVNAMGMFHTLARSHGIKYEEPQFKFCPFCGVGFGKQDYQGKFREDFDRNRVKRIRKVLEIEDV